ncbi:hypothetical protein GmHk_15G044005 [Glycine max]|nr:hypothetical protein GmHk_15G044005 [Glycine max]
MMLIAHISDQAYAADNSSIVVQQSGTIRIYVTEKTNLGYAIEMRNSDKKRLWPHPVSFMAKRGNTLKMDTSDKQAILWGVGHSAPNFILAMKAENDETKNT